MIDFEKIMKEAFPENEYSNQFKNTFVEIKGSKISLQTLAETFYEKGLRRSFEEEAKQKYAWTFEGELFDSIGYYAVVYQFSKEPLVVWYDGKCPRDRFGKVVSEREVIASKKLEVPEKALKMLEEWREMNSKELLLRDMADDIVYGKLEDYDMDEYEEYCRLREKYDDVDPWDIRK